MVHLEGLKVENDQLRKDNEQLHKLLHTVSLPAIQNHLHDSAGRISHVGNHRSKSRTKREEEKEAASPEQYLENWVPGKAAQIANDFRVQYGNDLQPELITELLRNLNKVWREREKKTIKRITHEYSEKLA